MVMLLLSVAWAALQPIPAAPIVPEARSDLTDLDARLKALEAHTKKEINQLRNPEPSSFAETGRGDTSFAQIMEKVHDLKAETVSMQRGVDQEIAGMKAHYLGGDPTSFLEDTRARANPDFEDEGWKDLEAKLNQVGAETARQKKELAAWNNEWPMTHFAKAHEQIESLRKAMKTSFVQIASMDPVPPSKQVDLAASFAAITSNLEKLEVSANKSLDTARDDLVNSGVMPPTESVTDFLDDPSKNSKVNKMFRSMKSKFDALQTHADQEWVKIQKDLKKSRDRRAAVEKGISSFLEVEPSFDDLQAQLAAIKAQTKRELEGMSSSLAERKSSDQLRRSK